MYKGRLMKKMLHSCCSFATSYRRMDYKLCTLINEWPGGPAYQTSY